MTQAQLDQQLDKSIEAFCVVPGVTAELAENLVSQGFFTFDDLSVIEPDQLVEMSGLSAEDCDRIIEHADVESARQEVEDRIANEQRKHAANHEASSSSKDKSPAVVEEAVDSEFDKGESDAVKEVELVAGEEELPQAGAVTVPSDTINESSAGSEDA